MSTSWKTSTHWSQHTVNLFYTANWKEIYYRPIQILCVKSILYVFYVSLWLYYYIGEKCGLQLTNERQWMMDTADLLTLDIATLSSEFHWPHCQGNIFNHGTFCTICCDCGFLPSTSLSNSFLTAFCNLCSHIMCAMHIHFYLEFRWKLLQITDCKVSFKVNLNPAAHYVKKTTTIKLEMTWFISASLHLTNCHSFADVTDCTHLPHLCAESPVLEHVVVLFWTFQVQISKNDLETATERQETIVLMAKHHVVKICAQISMWIS